MNTIAVIGLLWGDEGKGKIVDLLGEGADIIVRYQGGTNAGHTVYHNGSPLVLHLIPSGIFNKKVICVIGNGCVIDLISLDKEIKLLEKEGIKVKGRLFISKRAHVTFPFHIFEDKKSEKEKGSKNLGTTSRGIGPTYVDKFARTGVQIVDFLYPDELESKLRVNFDCKRGMVEQYSVPSIIDGSLPIAESLKEYFIDAVHYINVKINEGKKVLFEGAQGTLLDIDLGTYPYVTSSNPTVGGICTGTGVPASKIKNVIGVTKAYATRVGKGPFPTEFEEKFQEQFRTDASEFGATTGRPRKCGWFDAFAIKYACMVNGIQSIAVTKLDCLSGIRKIKIGVGYRARDQKQLESFPVHQQLLSEVVPMYEEFDGWSEDIRGVRSEKDLPAAALDYLKALECILNVRVVLVSTGPGREDTIVREDPW